MFSAPVDGRRPPNSSIVILRGTVARGCVNNLKMEGGNKNTDKEGGNASSPNIQSASFRASSTTTFKALSGAHVLPWAFALIVLIISLAAAVSSVVMVTCCYRQKHERTREREREREHEIDRDGGKTGGIPSTCGRGTVQLFC